MLLLLSLATAAISVRSYFRGDTVSYQRGPLIDPWEVYEVRSGGGGLALRIVVRRNQPQAHTKSAHLDYPFRLSSISYPDPLYGGGLSSPKFLGFGGYHSYFKGVLGSPPYHAWGLTMPWAVPLLIFLVPALFLARPCTAAMRARSRRQRGLCTNCGYDLRATPDRCPECGQEVKTSGERR